MSLEGGRLQGSAETALLMASTVRQGQDGHIRGVKILKKKILKHSRKGLPFHPPASSFFTLKTYGVKQGL